MRRWLFLAVILVVTSALSVWQWRAAAPLDVSDSAVRERPELRWSAGLQPLEWVVIGQWEYRSVLADSDGKLVAETGPNQMQQGSFPSDTENLFDVDCLPDIEKRPITAMARLRAWLGAD